MERTSGAQVSAHGEREVVITRGFNAPPSMVFDAFTKPDLLKRWLGGLQDWSFVVCEVDLRVGGAYRFVMRNTEGAEMGWGGVYREIDAPSRLVHTEKFDDPWYPGESLITNRFEEQPGDRTLLTMTMLCESREARDAVLASPMESGMELSFQRLDGLLAGEPQ